MARLNRMIAAAFVLGFAQLAQSPLSAAVHPVSVGLNANGEQWLARSANVGWVRIDIYWFEVNPSPGVWNFSPIDTRVSGSLANGQQILAILHGVPAWAGGGSKGNIPPLTTVGWSEYVRRIAQRYSGQIAAYEVWNEPNDSNSSEFGIGWDRNVWEPPLYVDFFQAAAQEIDTYSPGSLVVGPAFTSRLDTANKRSRASAILSQLHSRFFPGWSEFCCCFPTVSKLDALSFHNNGKDATSSLNTALELASGSISYLYWNAPCLYYHPIWITEYGWRANVVTEAGQREKICNITKMYTGSSNASQTGFDQLNIERSFIYLQKDPSLSQAVFRADNSPTPTVTQYLQPLGYPATQGTGTFPNCSGSGLQATTSLQSPEDLRAVLAALGLGDPVAGLPRTFKLTSAEVVGATVTAQFEGPGRDIIRVQVSPTASPAGTGTLSEEGAEWDRDGLRLDVLRPRPDGRAEGLVAKVAAALDPGFSSRCLIQHFSTNAEFLHHLGLRTPVTPHGFALAAAELAATRATSACSSASAAVLEFDFVWTFRNEDNEIIRAGIYRYGESFEGQATNPSSLHWTDGKGTRYWVAVDPANADGLSSSAYEVAVSISPERDLKPR